MRYNQGMNYRFFGLVLFGLTAAVLLRAALDPSGLVRYLFLIPNVLLAAIPLLLAPLFAAARTRLPRGAALPVLGLLGAVWLLFLPNAFYLLTDFMHLNPDALVNAPGNSATYSLEYARGDALYLYDSLLLFVVTAFGAYAGGLALLQAWGSFRRVLPKTAAQAALAAVMVLSAVGVYIGRYGRWNSWEGLTHPHRIAGDLWARLGDPSERTQILVVIFVMLLLEAVSLGYARSRSASSR